MPPLTRTAFLRLAAGLAGLAGAGGTARAQGRGDTLRYVTGGVVNSLDPVALGATPESTALSTSLYDRLLRFGQTSQADGRTVFDIARIEGELAEAFTLSPDGLSITLQLRAGATWHDGSPVTAEDAKWSLDRAVSAATMARAQLATGSLTDPAQFAVLDAGRLRITLPRPDRMALPNLATAFAPMFNSRLARQHATPEDPWATAWLRDNTAGGGAFTLQSQQPGRQVTLLRNERWASGPPPGFARVILQTVPEAATRAALVERGDADLAIGLQPEDVTRLQASPAVAVISSPMPSGFTALIFNSRMPPFDRPLVRQALALAVPYDAIFAAAAQGRGTPLSGAAWPDGSPPGAGFPQPLPLRQDLALARRRLAEAGFPEGFETTLSFTLSRAAFAEPAALLVQEAFGRIGVRLRIEKLPDAQMAAAVTEKRLPMLIERSFALFPSTEYFFRVFLSGPSRWNFSGWQQAEVDALLSAMRDEPDQARYDAMARRMIGLLAGEVPMALLWGPSFEVVTARAVTGFATRYNHYPDLRDLARG